jgi:endonuclease VIII
LLQIAVRARLYRGSVPEGDTIHHAANRIRPVLAGKIPAAIRTPQRRHGLERWPERLAGRLVIAVEAHGKHLFLRFDGGLTIHSHLRMTGAWSVHPHGSRSRRHPRRAWLVIDAGGFEVVQFDGPVLELLDDSRLRFDRRLASLGQDVIGEEFDESRFLDRLRAGDQSRTIGEALLDQQVLAGIGNVWKSEACFAARVDPSRPVAAVSASEALELVTFVRVQMAASARIDGHTRPKAVYARRGLPCPRCGASIRGKGQGEQNRSSFWCPGCQR